MAATHKLYDDEFSAEALKLIKEVEILGLARAAVLSYNVGKDIRGLEETFQSERREDPLLETTPLEAWIILKILPRIQEIRSNIDMEEGLLVEALKRFLRESVRETPPQYENEQVLNTTIKAYVPALEKLFGELLDRRKSLRTILRLRPDAYTIRQVASPLKPRSKREQLILRCHEKKWNNRRLAMELDNAGIKPRNRDFKSYCQMLSDDSPLFRSMKYDVLKKYSAIRVRNVPAQTPPSSKKRKA